MLCMGPPALYAGQNQGMQITIFSKLEINKLAYWPEEYYY